jgi:aminoglycoside phosphotransferase (APT) family kinase protein
VSSLAVTCEAVKAALTGGRPVPHHARVSFVSVDGRSLVVKRTRDGAGGARSLRHEALAAGHAARVVVSGAGAIATAPLCSDGEVLVFEHIDAPSLHTSLSERWSISAASACGAVLARLHASRVPAALGRCRPERPQRFPLTIQQYGQTPDSVLALLRSLELLPGVRDTLDEAHRRPWGSEAFVHGDFKPDNILLVGRPERATAVRVIDWELAGRGDPVEDVAALSAGLLSLALQGKVTATGAMSPDDFRRCVEQASSDTFCFFAAFLAAYREVRPLPVEPRVLLGDMALRILSRAQSIVMLTGTVNAVATLLLHAVRGMLTDVERSAAALTAAIAGHSTGGPR